MAIKLDNFVNVNIKYHLSSTPIGNRDTVVLILQGTKNEYLKTYSSLTEFKKDFPDDYASEEPKGLYYYGYTYFANGGLKLAVYNVDSEDSYDTVNITSETEYNALSAERTLYVKNGNEYNAASGYVEGTQYYIYVTGAENLETLVKSLPMEYIVIASDMDYDTMNTVAGKINTSSVATAISEDETMIWNKKFISCLPNDEELSLTNDVANGFILKYGEKGVEMSIAAYLSKINIDYQESVQDYDFTTEKVEYYSETGEKTIGYVYEDNDLVTSMMQANINIDGKLVGDVRNLGGNELNGRDLVNEYMLILLNQTLTERLVLLLTKKIKYNSTGLSLIGAEISRELQRYLNNGYLTTDKTWTDDDLVYKNVTIISKNTALKNGYKYVIMPFSVLTNEQLANHELPPIYVLVADSYSIRRINITGEVF